MRAAVYILSFALLCALAAVGVTYSKLQAERLAHQTSKAQYAEQVAAVEKKTADESEKRRKAEQELTHAQEAHGEEVAALRLDLDRARAADRLASSRVRDAAAAAAARARAQCAGATATELGASTDDPIGVLADVLGRAEERAGVLAEVADQRYIAGRACEREYDALRQALMQH